MGQNLTDWTVLTPEVMDRALKAAATVAREYDGVMERDDLLQEAYILCATNAARVKDYVAQDEYGHLYRWLWSRLTDLIRPAANRSNRTVAIDRLAD